jgi:outer membrane protein assembly factor BamB
MLIRNELGSSNISLRDGTIKCTEWKTNTIYCYTLTGQEIWTFKDENVIREPIGVALDKNRNIYVLHLKQREKKCWTILIAYQEFATINVDT